MSEVEFYCYFSYLGPFWLAGILGKASRSPRLRYHANQGLVLSLLEIIFIIISAAVAKPLRGIEEFGDIIFYFVVTIFIIISFVLAAKGMMNVAHHREKPIPIIGKITILR